jgi:hypothetical protein
MDFKWEMYQRIVWLYKLEHLEVQINDKKVCGQ